MVWKSVDSQVDLDRLNKLVCWDDSRTVEYYGTISHEKYFPPDISRSGFQNKNIHILCDVCSSISPYLELVLIDCDCLDPSFLENMFFRGRVDTLKRVEAWDSNKSTLMRCSRLLYRFVEGHVVRPGSYFRTSDHNAGTV